MFVGLAITFTYLFLVWLVFFKLRLLKFTMMWGLISVFFGLHLLLIFLIGMRFVAPLSTDARVVQHTIQLIPRLPEPTLVTEVLAAPNVPVKKGQPLFQFDRRPYEYKVQSVQAQLAAAQQHVRELKAQWEAARHAVAEAQAQRGVLKAQWDAATAAVAEARAKRLVLKSAWEATVSQVSEAKAKRELAKATLSVMEMTQKESAEAISKLRLDQSRAGLAEAEATVGVTIANEAKARTAYEVEAEAAINIALANEAKAKIASTEEAEAAIKVAQANEEKARLAYQSEINGENTTVAQIKADLAQAQYYLDNTTMVAPADGHILNLQVQAGMVAGTVRFGAIASFVVDADRYLLATYFQEHLKFVKAGQPVEIAFDLYPGQIFKGKVQSIWQGSGEGQMLPSGDLPKFSPQAPGTPQGQFAVQIVLEDEDQSKFPIGAQGASVIYTGGGGFAALRKVGLRGRTWLNWLYPLSF